MIENLFRLFLMPQVIIVIVVTFILLTVIAYIASYKKNADKHKPGIKLGKHNTANNSLASNQRALNILNSPKTGF